MQTCWYAIPEKSPCKQDHEFRLAYLCLADNPYEENIFEIDDGTLSNYSQIIVFGLLFYKIYQFGHNYRICKKFFYYLKPPYIGRNPFPSIVYN